MVAGPVMVAFPHATVYGMESGWWDYFTRRAKKRGLSQADVARELGIPSSTVSRWRTHAPSPEILRRLAPILRQPVLRLFVEAGHLAPDEVEVPDDPAPGDLNIPAEQAIEADDTYSREAKDLLLAMARHLRGDAPSQPSDPPGETAGHDR